MRTLLLAALSLSALIPSHDADACGNYRPEPRVMRLSTHFVGDGTSRTFVLSGDAEVPPGVTWRMLAPMSYDATQIADNTLRMQPVLFTLVGPSGTRVVGSRKEVYLSKSWDFQKPQHAFDLGNAEGFSVAIVGKHADAKWTALEEVPRTKRELREWAAAQGVTPYDGESIYVNRVANTKFKTIVLFPKNGKKMVTFLEYEDKNLGPYEGTAMGAVTVDGTTNLVIVDGARTTQVFLTNGMLGKI